jgi:hypothetical protein
MLQRAEIDQMVTTARAYPRTPSLVQRRIMEMATLDAESAEECIYALPRGGKPIRGPSIRFAEILKQAFGNCQAAARVVHVDRSEMFVEAEGVFVDYETNARSTARVRRRISDKKGKVLSDDMIIVTGNAACSIAMRNAILTGIPKPLWRRAYEAVEGTIAGDVMTLSQRRDNAMKAAAMYGVTPEQVYAALGVIGADDLTTDHFLTLKGLIQSIKNGESTVEEAFGLGAQKQPESTVGERLRAAASSAPVDGETVSEGFQINNPGPAAPVSDGAGSPAAPGGDDTARVAPTYSAPTSSPVAEHAAEPPKAAQQDGPGQSSPAPGPSTYSDEDFTKRAIAAVRICLGAMTPGSTWADVKEIVGGQLKGVGEALGGDAAERLRPVYARLKSMVEGEIDRADALAIIAGIVGCEEHELA